jgi:hypothetical protein
MDELKTMFRYALGFAAVASVVAGAYVFLMLRVAEAIQVAGH